MDLDVIKQRLNALEKTGNSNTGERRQLFWKPEIGKQTIRIVPSKFNSKMPFTEMLFYYGIGVNVMPSRTNYSDESGDPLKDPIIEFTKQLRQTSESENWKLAKKLDPKVRYFAPILVRGREDEGVKVWQFGKELYETFLQLAVDEEVGDYTEVSSGRDIKLVTVGPEVTGTKYNRTTASPSMKVSPVSEDADQVKVWLDDQVNPKDLFKNRVVDYDLTKQHLASWLNPEGSSQEGDIIDEDKSPANNNYSLNTSNNQVKQTKLDKFDSLFDEDKTDDLPF
tara:strand:+ start:6267 stop:7109 length:843 start_codon:yes stop_codon:yes gene_type:complete